MSYPCRMKSENITKASAHHAYSKEYIARLCCFEIELFCRLNDSTNPELWQCASGLCIDLLVKLAEAISFDFDLFRVEDGLWGALDPVSAHLPPNKHIHSQWNRDFVRFTCQWRELSIIITEALWFQLISSLMVKIQENLRFKVLFRLLMSGMDWWRPFMTTRLTCVWRHWRVLQNETLRSTSLFLSSRLASLLLWLSVMESFHPPPSSVSH